MNFDKLRDEMASEYAKKLNLPESTTLIQLDFAAGFDKAAELYKQEIEKLKSANDVLMTACEFYGDKFKWRTNSGKIGITELTDGRDSEIVDGIFTNGKLARQAIESAKNIVEGK